MTRAEPGAGATPSALALRRRTLPVRFALRSAGVEQAARLAICLAAVALREAGARPLDCLQGRLRREARRATRQADAARRLARTLGELKGAFAKAGQFASLRYDVLPPEVRSAFATLQDRVPPLPFEVIAAEIERELGGPLAAHFAQFEREPVGAASVAQVHRAWLPSGEGVAVKVQYPWLEHSLAADLRLSRWLLRRLARGARPSGAVEAPAVDADRLFAEFAAGLGEELDFEREARVAGEIAANLAGETQVVVPLVHAALSSRRVLTVTWIPAIPITDRESLARRGVPARPVLETLGRAYARQVFVDGLFHADPHPGNLFVIDEPEASVRPRVLFVDFGLSKRLDPALRREMRLGIHALLRQDLEAFVAGMERMGMIAPGARDGVRTAVSAMFDRIRAEGSPLGLAGGQVLALKDEAKRLLAETPGLQLPNDLLLWAKTLSYLFALGEHLAPEVDLVRTTLPYLLRWLAERDG